MLVVASARSAPFPPPSGVRCFPQRPVEHSPREPHVSHPGRQARQGHFPETCGAWRPTRLRSRTRAGVRRCRRAPPASGRVASRSLDVRWFLAARSSRTCVEPCRRRGRPSARLAGSGWPRFARLCEGGRQTFGLPGATLPSERAKGSPPPTRFASVFPARHQERQHPARHHQGRQRVVRRRGRPLGKPSRVGWGRCSVAEAGSGR